MDVIMVMGSITSANRLKSFVEKNMNIKIYVIQTPKSVKNNGCSYSVTFSEKHYEEVKKSAKYLNLKSKEAFKMPGYERID